MCSFAFFIHVKLESLQPMDILAVQGMHKRHTCHSLWLAFFCLHSVKRITEHNTDTDHKLSDATGLTVIYDTQNIQEKDIP